MIGEPRHRLSFSKLNQKFFELRKRWLLVTLDMFGGVLGPTFGLDGGPCYDCLVDCSIRQFDRAFEKTEFKDFLKEEGDHELNAMPLAQIVLSYAALEAVKIRSQMITPKTFDGFYTFDMFNFRMNYSAVSPSPRCPVCSAHARSPNL